MATAKTDVSYVVSVGDIHAGSAFAPCPDEIAGQYDLTIHASRVQRWLTRCWEHFTDEYVPAVVGRRKFALLVNGDVLEGNHHGGHQLVSAAVKVQRRIALELLRPLAARASEVYVVKGTECHTRDDEEDIAAELKARRCPDTDNFAPDWWDINVRGCLTSFRHHIPATSRRALKGSQLSIQLIEEQAEAAGAGTPIPRVVVRSHRHTYGSYDDGCGMAVVLPAWQLLTRHGHKVVPAAQRGIMVGGVVLDYSRVSDPFDLPTVHRNLYRPKP
jgi:hypothetical protein